MKKKYNLVKEYIIEKIENGVYSFGKAIPSERDLAEMFQVNRMTIRKAIEELMFEGILVRKVGSGTYLKQNKLNKTDIIDVTKKNIKVLKVKKGDELNYGYKALNISKTEEYFIISRVRMIDEIPQAYEIIYLRKEFFEKLNKEDYLLGLRVLAKKYHEDVEVYDTVEALLALKKVADLLKVQVGAPILQIKSYFKNDGNIFMHARTYHPGDSYIYESLSNKLK